MYIYMDGIDSVLFVCSILSYYSVVSVRTVHNNIRMSMVFFFNSEPSCTPPYYDVERTETYYYR